MSAPLKPPTDELARRILASVSYQERIPAGRFTSRLGITRGSVRGLPELHLYLTPDESALPAINLDRLADWIEQVIADVDLAREVRTTAAAASSYVDACKAMHPLVGTRLAQARSVLGADSGTGPGATEPRA